MSELVPADVRHFILDNIDSVSELEALILMRKCAGQEWSAESLAQRLYIDQAAAARLLAHLAGGGLCAGQDGIYHYGPRDGTLAALVDQLADLYVRYLIPVTNLIHNKPSRIQQFADAFIFRKDK